MSFHIETLDKEKRRLRGAMRQRLAARSPVELAEASAHVAVNLLAQIPAGFSGRILAFHPTPREPDILGSLRTQFPEADILLPRVELAGSKVTGELTLHSAKLGDVLFPNRYQILEPGPENPVAPLDVDFAVVPGLAFAPKGGRLGHGGGYYDRLIPLLAPRCPRIGICFDFQILDHVPRGPHDAQVNQVITDQRAL